MKWLGLLAACFFTPLILYWAVHMPRRLVAEIHLDHRILVREPKLPKALALPEILGISALWLILSIWIVAQEQSLVWQVFTLVLSGCLLLGGVIDARTGLLPFQVSAWIALSGLLYQATIAPSSISTHLIHAVLLYFGLRALNQLTQRLTRQQLLGGGDVMLLFSVASFLPLDAIAWCLLLASITGYLEGRMRKRPIIRFGPHLAVAILSYWLSRVMLV